jgi:hypothetical protein
MQKQGIIQELSSNNLWCGKQINTIQFVFVSAASFTQHLISNFCAVLYIRQQLVVLHCVSAHYIAFSGLLAHYIAVSSLLCCTAFWYII